MRVLACVEDGALRLWSRNENDVTVSFPELAGLPAAVGHDLVLDGEIVAFLEGVPRFGALADRMHVRDRLRASLLARNNPVTLLIFDVLSIDGRDVTGLPLIERRELLAGLDLDDDRWKVPPAYEDGDVLQQATLAQGLEGIVSKKLSSTYVPGRRSSDWLKFPNRPRTSYVVGGWRHETDSATRLGAVLVGSYDDGGQLVYRGRVGSGIAGREGQKLMDHLAPLRADACPFDTEVPKIDAKGAVWIRPEVIVDIESLGMTPQGRLRQPAYCGVRLDLTPDDLRAQDG
jgi:bifunctional non-homologous end joining protein LigD